MGGKQIGYIKATGAGLATPGHGGAGRPSDPASAQPGRQRTPDDQPIGRQFSMTAVPDARTTGEPPPSSSTCIHGFSALKSFCGSSNRRRAPAVKQRAQGGRERPQGAWNLRAGVEQWWAAGGTRGRGDSLLAWPGVFGSLPICASQNLFRKIYHQFNVIRDEASPQFATTMLTKKT